MEQDPVDEEELDEEEDAQLDETADEEGEEPVPLTPEQLLAQRNEILNSRAILREAQRGDLIDDGLAADFTAVLDGDVGVQDPCPKCGGSMNAEQDPDSLLSFPMIFLWTCEACGHHERREDTGTEG